MAAIKRNLFMIPFLKQSAELIGKTYSQVCPKCNSDRFNVIIDHIFNGSDNLEICSKCRRHAKVLNHLIRLFFTYFNIDLSTRKNIYNNLKLRKTIKNYLKGLALFGPRKPFVTGAPLSVVWNITNNCNLKCSHCFNDSHFNQVSRNELTTNQAKKVIQILAANDVVTLNFCGGEPLIRKDIYDLIQYANQKNLFPSLSTNATLLSKDACKKVYNAGIRNITISLDSIFPINHDRLRKVEGAYDMTIEGIKNAVEFGKFNEIIISTTMTDFNYTEIPQIYEFVKKLGATRYYVGRLLPNGRGKDFINHDPSHEIKRKVLDDLAHKLIRAVNNNDEIMVITRAMPYFSKACYELSNGTIYPLCELITGYESEITSAFNNQLANFMHKLSSTFSGCAAGLFYIGLSSDGQVQPCATSSHIRIGNILDQGLHDIWVNHPIFSQIRNRKRKFGKCAKCDSRGYCGGCLVTAYNSTGEWHGSDLSCPY